MAITTTLSKPSKPPTPCTFLYKSDPVRGQLWAEVFRQHAPDIDFRIWPDIGEASHVRFLAAWVPPEAKPAPVVGKTPDNLPALLIQVTGAVTASNLPEYKAHALEVFRGINRTLATE